METSLLYFSLNIVKLLPGLMAVTGAQELFFRQVLFRRLEMQCIAGTAVAFGGAYPGPLLIGGEVAGPFYLSQTLYMVWIGLLLRELRRATDS